MTHPLVSYWQSTFSQYRMATGEPAFHLPLFPDPLMSPDFREIGGQTRLNRISLTQLTAPAGFKLARHFRLGTCRLQPGECTDFAVELSPLHRSVLRQDFWEILGESFPKDVAFLKNLLPFLPCTNAKYTTAFVSSGGTSVGLINVGVSAGVGLVLTAALRKKARGSGLCNELVRVARQVALSGQAHTAVYWTEHDFLLKYADEVHEYQVFTAD